MSDDPDLEDLKAQTSQGDRLDSAAKEMDRQDLVDDIVDELEAIDAGDQQKTVSVWDGQLAAFIRALEANPDHLDAVGNGLQEQLDIEETEADRSSVLRLALRVGFQEAAPEQFEAVREAVRKQATKGL
ncbi:hypothetical protein BDK61_4333 [Haloarcula quadrata]|jgi:hypothetical protein|uniref:DUF8115 domain-containing protein n=1 Tax=Haloarcula quadrata TaxID=182779 RepID=A0A495QQP7_9EURY|nr:hypothetical protein [Haloarcula quadrata]RKS75816.1 hypothetical protein BDK61_4333 [Haloarcula quadrata]